MMQARRAALFLTIALTLVPRTSVLAQDLTGQWKGRIEPTNLSAELELELRRADAAWRAEMTFQAGPEGGPLPVEELRVDGDSVFVRTKIEGADVSLTLALEDELLRGSVQVTENGTLLAEGPAALARASDASGQTRLLGWLNEQGESIDAQRRTAVIETALQLFSANYLDVDAAARAVANVHERASRGEYSSLTSPARLAELLGRHLAEATGDRHVQVKFSAGRVPDPLASAEETTAELEQLRRDAEAENFGIGETRVMRGNVGYLPFNRFFRGEVAGDALADAMESLATTDALIVDLRESRGGDPVMAVLAASWFFDGRPRHWNDLVRRFDGTTTQFWTATWLPGPRYVGKPLYVLTAQRTFSAPESFAYEMQQTRRATIVGEVTGGGAHPGAWFPIDDRFAIFIPLSRYVSAVSGGDWEGTGVKPDIECVATEAVDCAYRAALEALGRE
jgi:hypothetical protein